MRFVLRYLLVLYDSFKNYIGNTYDLFDKVKYRRYIMYIL